MIYSIWELDPLVKRSPPQTRFKRKLPPLPPPTRKEIEEAEARRATRSSTEALAEQNAALVRRMKWRIDRYGFVCLTLRELEACQWDMQFDKYKDAIPADDIDVADYFETRTAHIQSVASRMGCTPRNVYKLLKRADETLLYLANQDISFSWVKSGALWRLNAPVGVEVVEVNSRRKNFTDVLAI